MFHIFVGFHIIWLFQVSHFTSSHFQASLESELNRSGSQLTKFVSLCREIMTRFVQQHFPTIIEGKVGNIEKE